MGKIIDITGKKYNRLTVLNFVEIRNHKAYWLCECECGNKKIVCTSALKNSSIKSCGCLQKETRHQNRKFTKGIVKGRLYNIYHNIKTRCYNSNSKSYKNYGKRNIKMCNEWFNDFTRFYNWAIKNGYNDTLTIERINVNGDYEPSNCKWITLQEQSYNRRNTLNITINNQTKSLSEWCDIYNMPYLTVYMRIKKHKYSALEALTKPINTKKRNKLWRGGN